VNPFSQSRIYGVLKAIKGLKDKSKNLVYPFSQPRIEGVLKAIKGLKDKSLSSGVLKAIVLVKDKTSLHIIRC